MDILIAILVVAVAYLIFKSLIAVLIAAAAVACVVIALRGTSRL